MRLEVITREPEKEARPTPILFVHGACMNAGCWDEYFLPYFASQGYSSHAVSLRGHGDSEGRDRLRWTGVGDYVDDVAQVAGEFDEQPVLIGHSMGGLIIQKYLEEHSAAAAVLLASVPTHGFLPGALRFTRRHPLVYAKCILTMSTRPMVASPDLAQDLWFSADMPQENVEAFFQYVQEESFRALLDMELLRLPKPERVKRIPFLVLGAANDKDFSEKEIKDTASAYGAQVEIFPDMAHGMMLEDDWQDVADRIIAWLQEQGF